jgi:glyoxylase-like metal-dependent hydrolase (beta-lactamase superfamily II)
MKILKGCALQREVNSNWTPAARDATLSSGISMVTIAQQTYCVDTEHGGNKQVIACALLDGAGGPALVDPGPASTLPTVKAKLARRGLDVAELGSILLTHIHLDHAGATGTLVKENPKLRVFVHERGAPHMAHPQKLLESAKRLYGDEMDRLWGEFLPVPQENLTVLRGGEQIKAGGRALDVEYTPGHASHHVSYFDQSTGIAFTGDTTGIRIANQKCLLPPTPPPDIDLELWAQSLVKIRARKPAKFFLTHFSAAFPAEEHLAMFEEALAKWAEFVRGLLERDATDEDRLQQFVAAVFEELKRLLPEDEAVRYMKGATPELCWLGLARYWRKRAATASTAMTK